MLSCTAADDAGASFPALPPPHLDLITALRRGTIARVTTHDHVGYGYACPARARPSSVRLGRGGAPCPQQTSRPALALPCSSRARHKERERERERARSKSEQVVRCTPERLPDQRLVGREVMARDQQGWMTGHARASYGITMGLLWAYGSGDGFSNERGREGGGGHQPWVGKLQLGQALRGVGAARAAAGAAERPALARWLARAALAGRGGVPQQRQSAWSTPGRARCSLFPSAAAAGLYCGSALRGAAARWSRATRAS